LFFGRKRTKKVIELAAATNLPSLIVGKPVELIGDGIDGALAGRRRFAIEGMILDVGGQPFRCRLRGSRSPDHPAGNEPDRCEKNDCFSPKCAHAGFDELN